MKRVVISLLIVGMLLTSCSSTPIKAEGTPVATGEATLPSPVSNGSYNPPVSGAVTLDQLKMPDSFYTLASNSVGPGDILIRVTAEDLINGKVKEWPVYVHNGDGLQAKILRVETEFGETVATIPLNIVLANSGLLDIISIESTILKDTNGQLVPDTDRREHLEAIAYDATTRLLTIKGFEPSAIRYVKITYKTLSSYKIYYNLRGEGEKGYALGTSPVKDWFSLDHETVVLRPFETKTLTARLTIPPNTLIKGKYVFWVVATSVSILPNQVTAMYGNAQRVFVDID